MSLLFLLLLLSMFDASLVLICCWYHYFLNILHFSGFTFYFCILVILVFLTHNIAQSVYITLCFDTAHWYEEFDKNHLLSTIIKNQLSIFMRYIQLQIFNYCFTKHLRIQTLLLFMGKNRVCNHLQRGRKEGTPYSNYVIFSTLWSSRGGDTVGRNKINWAVKIFL